MSGTEVFLLRSTDTGAPTLNGTAGSLIALLDACLVNGYNSKTVTITRTGTTAFDCYGEYSGLVAQGSTGVDFAPINPITSVPYFTINLLGWGSGWSVGNVLRFITIAANFPLWLARTTLQSDSSVYTDNFKMQIRGDAN